MTFFKGNAWLMVANNLELIIIRSCLRHSHPIGHISMMTTSNGIFFASLTLRVGNSPVNSPHTGQLRVAMIFSLICAWINGWANHRDAGDLRRHRAQYDVTVIFLAITTGLISRCVRWIATAIHLKIGYLVTCSSLLQTGAVTTAI